jgi:carbonic anhydrase
MLTFTDEEVKGQIQEEVGLDPHFALESFSELEEDVSQSITRVSGLVSFIPHK